MPELNVSKKSIGKLLGEMQGRKFIIPDFQRPYKWNIEKCETLWKDLVDFAEGEAHNGSDYFMGTIVSYVNETKNAEIIDGQQRITSFLLLLRAFYRKLQDMPDSDKEVTGLKNKVAPCIWDTNRLSGEVDDYSKIRITSLVATEEDNDKFHELLNTGNSNNEYNDNYSKNYSYFKNSCDEYARINPLGWKELCITILEQCIILPIECDTSETALTIFSTLNDRGMPLADSDIFKAKIYKSIDGDQNRRDFTDTWKELTTICQQANNSIDDIFRYYTHVIRAREKDNSKEVGLRKFYNDRPKYLNTNITIPEVMSLAYFWRYINKGIEPEDDSSYDISTDSRKYLHCLQCYPNEFWKYLVSVFFLKNKDNVNFDGIFSACLRKLVSYLFVKFIDKPSVNAIKDSIYSAYININENNTLLFRSIPDLESIKRKFEDFSSSRIARAVLLLDAYLEESQEGLIPDSFHIEHIFPKKWQETNYKGWNKIDANKYLDKFGNKIVLERKLNIQAGNDYFGRKKEKYSLSKISCVNSLGSYSKNDWTREDIETRELALSNRIISFCKAQLTQSN